MRLRTFFLAFLVDTVAPRTQPANVLVNGIDGSLRTVVRRDGVLARERARTAMRRCESTRLLSEVGRLGLLRVGMLVVAVGGEVWWWSGGVEGGEVQMGAGENSGFV